MTAVEEHGLEVLDLGVLVLDGALETVNLRECVWRWGSGERERERERSERERGERESEREKRLCALRAPRARESAGCHHRCSV